MSKKSDGRVKRLRREIELFERTIAKVEQGYGLSRLSVLEGLQHSLGLREKCLSDLESGLQVDINALPGFYEVSRKLLH